MSWDILEKADKDDLHMLKGFALAVEYCNELAHREGDLKVETTLKKCVVGFARLAASYGNMMLWAVGKREYPSFMVAVRLILELGARHAWFTKTPADRDWKAQHLNTHFFQVLQQVAHSQGLAGETKERLGRLCSEADKELKRMTPKGSRKPPSTQGFFSENKMTKTYNAPWKVGSAFAHSEGFAVMSAAMGAFPPKLSLIFQQCKGAVLLPAIDYVETFPETETARAKELEEAIKEYFRPDGDERSEEQQAPEL